LVRAAKKAWADIDGISRSKIDEDFQGLRKLVASGELGRIVRFEGTTTGSTEIERARGRSARAGKRRAGGFGADLLDYG